MAIPEKGRLFAMNAAVPPEQTLVFFTIAQGAFERNEGGRQLTPTVFLVMDGVVSGVAAPTEPAKKKGFFSRLFS